MQQHIRGRPMVASLFIAFTVVSAMPTAAMADRATICVNAAENVFDDVATTNVHAANIDCVAAYGLTVGVGGGNYDPDGVVPRGQMASFVVNLVEVASDEEIPSAPTTGFSDIAGTTHAANIAAAADLDITRGVTPTSFAPRTPVTRAQMATFVAQAIRAAGGELPADAPSAFDDTIASIHGDNIDALASAGIIVGRGPGTYAPGAEVTRAQMATYLANAAGFLDEAAKWLAPPLPTDNPQVLEVSAATETSNDTLTVQWDEDVTIAASGEPAHIEVFDTADEVSIAVATDIELASANTYTVTLDSDLDGAQAYWLHVAAGVALDADGNANGAQTLPFPWDAAEDDGGGGGSSTPAPTDPTITGVETDPANDRLVVTFDRDVTCPNTANSRAAWDLINLSVAGSGTAGAPTSVGPGGHADECWLSYPVQDGDFGLLDYTAPADALDAVSTSAGGRLRSVDDVDVVDGIAPELLSIVADADADQIAVTFSEPILCSSLGESDFEIVVMGFDMADQITGFSCTAAEAEPVIELGPNTLTAGDPVEVWVVELIYDEGADNTVVLDSMVSAMAS